MSSALWVSLFCLLSVQQLNREKQCGMQKRGCPVVCTKQTNKPRSYLNRGRTGECECSSDQTTTATVVCSTLIVHPSTSPSNELLFCLSVGPSFSLFTQTFGGLPADLCFLNILFIWFSKTLMMVCLTITQLDTS